ncbi:MAG: hypothetical protein J7639_29805, partial [Paenibacillaceae bacterium]|nr:hypothetical protein [Paenibacillaceae bacterium]
TVKAVRMFPAAAEHNFSLEAWSCGELFEALEHYLVPLFLGMDQLGWNDLFELCRSYPALPIVLTEVNYRMDRRLYPLLERFPQLRIETIGYKVHLGIEELCKRFGAERLVFGSGMPLYSGAAAVSMVRYAGIGEREKRLIAGDNLRAMLKEVRL